MEPPRAEDLKFRATAVRAGDWSDWVKEQKEMANLGDDVGVYVGLRMDGRVRSSGKGRVPFERFRRRVTADGFVGRRARRVRRTRGRRYLILMRHKKMNFKRDKKLHAQRVSFTSRTVD